MNNSKNIKRTRLYMKYVIFEDMEKRLIETKRKYAKRKALHKIECSQNNIKKK